MAVKVTLEFESMTAAAVFLSNYVPGTEPAPSPLPDSPPAAATAEKKTRKSKTEAEKPAAAPATTTAPVVPQVAAPAGVTLDDNYLKDLTEQVLAVAAEVGRDNALGILAKYKMADGVTPVKQCSALPKEAWVAVKTEAEGLLSVARVAKAAKEAAAATTSLI